MPDHSDPLDRCFAPLRRLSGAEPTPLTAIASRAARLRRRRRRTRVAAGGGLLAVGLAASLLLGVRARQPVTLTGPPVTRPAGAGTGVGGELAYTSGGRLVIVDRSGRHRSIALPGGGVPFEPTWSADGRWLAYLLLPSGRATQPPGALWVVRADGTDAHRVSDALEFAWDPREDALAYLRGPGVFLDTLSGRGVHVARLGSRGIPQQLAWSPSGGTLAVSTVAFGGAGDTSRIVLLPVGTRPSDSRVLATSRSAGYELAGWWPDGEGLLYWSDQGFSASIAADGLPLDSIDAVSGRTHTLTRMLPNADWLAWSPSGTSVAVVAGIDRVVWSGAKHLEICRPDAGTCRAEPQPAGTTSTDPAWTATGQLLFARSTGATADMGPPPRVPGLGGSPPFSWKDVQAWAAAGGLRTAQATSGVPQRSRPLPGGAGGQAPTPAGADVLFVHHASLWALTPGSAAPIRLTGPLGPYGPTDPGYYGYIDWNHEFTWHP